MTKDEAIKLLFGESAQAFEEHTERIGVLLDKAQGKFHRDHTGFSAAVGVLLIASAVALAYFNRAETLSIVLAIIGGLLVVIALLLRFFESGRQSKSAETLIALERERARLALRTNVLKHFWLHEEPQSLSLDQLRILIGDGAPVPPAAPTPSESRPLLSETAPKTPNTALEPTPTAP